MEHAAPAAPPRPAPLPGGDARAVLRDLRGSGYIYGAGGAGALLARRLVLAGQATLLGFVDQRSAELPRYLGKPVVAPDALPGLAFDWVLVPPRHRPEMAEELRRRAVPEARIVELHTLEPDLPPPAAREPRDSGQALVLGLLALGLGAITAAGWARHRFLLPACAGALLLLLAEAACRALFRRPPRFQSAILDQCSHPYLVTASTPGGGWTTWNDLQRGVRVEAMHARNRQGFRMDQDLDFARPSPKAPGEKLVLITGGSTVHGVGASGPQADIAARLETFLNRGQDRCRYRVLNFAQSNWIAFQEYLALALWGKWLEPDWIVVVDGHNDIAVPVAHSQGAGYPMFYHHLRSYVDGYLAGQARPSFYRGALENRLLRHSQLYRTLSGRQFVPRDQHLVFDEGFPRVATEVRFEDIERQLAFYRHAQELILGLAPRAQCLFALQPLIQPHAQLFALSDGDLERMRLRHQDRRVGYREFYPLALPYFMCRAAAELERVAGAAPDRAAFVNLSEDFPEDPRERAGCFIDSIHLNDFGCAWAGKLLAYRILARDLPGRRADLEAELAADLEILGAVRARARGPRFQSRYRDMVRADSLAAGDPGPAPPARLALSRFLLGFAFFAILVPTAALLRLLGRDFLRARRWKRGAESQFRTLDHWFGPDDFTSP